MQIKLLIVEDEALTRESLERVVSGSRLKDSSTKSLPPPTAKKGCAWRAGSAPTSC